VIIVIPPPSVLLSSEPEAREQSRRMIKMNDDDVHYIDGGSDGVRASEPPGEGAVGWNVASIVNDDDIDGGGGGQCVDFLLFCQNPDFDSDFGLDIRILTSSRVELIDKTSILRLETTTNR